ncbi:hypothetical protein D3C73_1521760 [compost metagenome]
MPEERMPPDPDPVSLGEFEQAVGSLEIINSFLRLDFHRLHLVLRRNAAVMLGDERTLAG